MINTLHLSPGTNKVSREDCQRFVSTNNLALEARCRVVVPIIPGITQEFVLRVNHTFTNIHVYTVQFVTRAGDLILLSTTLDQAKLQLEKLSEIGSRKILGAASA